MFPTQEVSLDNLKSSDNEVSITGKSFLFDFNLGDFPTNDGKLTEISGIEALKLWIQKVLKTEKFKFKIYENKEYGATLLELVNADYPIAFKKSEIERVVTETLLKNTAIKSLNNFNFERNKRTLKVSFTAYTIYGTSENEVVI